MSAALGFSSGDLPLIPARPAGGESEGSIELGTEDSDTDSSISVEGSNFEEETSSLQGGSDGGVPITENEHTADEDNVEDDHVGSEHDEPDYGYILDGDRGYIHPDGREEVWYRQPVLSNPEAPGWTTINSGPRGPPASYAEYRVFEDEPEKPVPVTGSEVQLAAASTRAEIEEIISAEEICSCGSSNPLLRTNDELPFFDHDNGCWTDPAAKNPQRTAQPFVPYATRLNMDKKRKQEAMHDTDDSPTPGATWPESESPSAMAVSAETSVPRCDLHFPITGVLDDDWKFMRGSRFIKQRLRLPIALDKPENSTDEYDNDSDSDSAAATEHEPTNVHSTPLHTSASIPVEADNHPAEDANDWETDDGEDRINTYIQYVDQAYQLRLIEDDAPARCRRMNMHAPPASWADRNAITKLNRWIHSFRDRSSKRNAATTLPSTTTPPPTSQPTASASSSTSTSTTPPPANQTRATKSTAKPRKTRLAWTPAELDAVCGAMVEQLRDTGSYSKPRLLAVLRERWPERRRTLAALTQTVQRYGLGREARGVVFGGGDADVGGDGGKWKGKGKGKERVVEVEDDEEEGEEDGGEVADSEGEEDEEEEEEDDDDDDDDAEDGVRV
ncbi:sodium potassium calcium exchanger 1 isoform x1 [Diplodia corticola]|uniref:Sodium potassium calcium exchanger 1 isoform x1 n=1 Tax=Diplodia corticola TaxID=236234 RepID=A0A1J9QS67_9PEZI|nr:sodium potassium calcium exchanger 1 isoform x1 [Diplodia corticola]OJD31265.1 sodium potassium calcium exchanger 1 isoform x1 [Diplodia corticola]